MLLLQAITVLRCLWTMPEQTARSVDANKTDCFSSPTEISKRFLFHKLKKREAPPFPCFWPGLGRYRPLHRRVAALAYAAHGSTDSGSERSGAGGAGRDSVRSVRVTPLCFHLIKRLGGEIHILSQRGLNGKARAHRVDPQHRDWLPRL